MTQTATSPQRKPVLDEASFQQLLSAAYVLQEHNDRLRGKEVQADFAKNLSAIVETQKLIQTMQLDLEAAAKLVAERAQKITSASGAAIGIIEKGDLVYRAGTGSAAVDAGARVAPASSFSADCLGHGSAVNYTDTSANPPARARLFQDREVKSFIAVPVYHAGQVAGVLELRFARVNAFREADLRTAELMAGLLSEAMATAARMKWKHALASERQSMLEALERIKPQLERLGTESLDSVAASKRAAASLQSPAAGSETGTRSGDICSVCGSDFFDRAEAFCGICGSARTVAPEIPLAANSPNASLGIPRAVSIDAPSTPSSAVITPYGADEPANGDFRANAAQAQHLAGEANALPASLQELIELSAIQQNPAAHVEKHFEKREVPKAASAVTPPVDTAPAVSAAFDDPFAPRKRNAAAPLAEQAAYPVETASPGLAGNEALRIVPVDLVPVDHPARHEALQPSPWGSAKKAHEWLEAVNTHRGPAAKWMAHQWQTRRANIYIGLAGLILLIVLSGWGMRPASTATMAGNASPTTAGRRQAPAAPKLTAFESLLVSLGLAEAPPAPVYLGNPDTQVWVDVHTALYHCPGSDLFGKTPDGRLSTQREAQQDQFEPANRKACP